MRVIAEFKTKEQKIFEDVQLVIKDVGVINDKLTDVYRLIYNKGGNTFFPATCLYAVENDIEPNVE